jgi:hypothetical protein
MSTTTAGPGPAARPSYLTVVHGDADPYAVENGRRAASEALVRGFEAAVAALDESDHDEILWYRARLREARVFGGMPRLAPVTGGA